MGFKLRKFSILPKTKGLVLLLFIIIGVGFFVPQVAAAEVDDFIATVLGWIIFPFVLVFGKILTLVIAVLIWIAQWNEFINSQAVSKGWIIIRDIMNMFFVIVLLFIAFSAVLKIERYNYKRTLASFFVVAVLVNFSKLICGIIIDFTQILMLTFIKPIAEMGGSDHIIKMLGISEVLGIDTDVKPYVSGWDKVIVLFMSLLYVIVACVVIGAMCWVLFLRIVMIWFLVILSPIAFMANILPMTQGYARQWWEKFVKQLIIGPVMAFFLWLSLAITQASSGPLRFNPGAINQEVGSATETSEQLLATVSKIGTTEYLRTFMFAIAMLVITLKVAVIMGVAGSSVAGKALGKLQKAAKAPLGKIKKGLQGVKRVATGVVKGAAMATTGGTAALAKMGGKALLGAAARKAAAKGAPKLAKGLKAAAEPVRNIRALRRKAGSWLEQGSKSRAVRMEQRRQKVKGGEKLTAGERAGSVMDNVTHAYSQAYKRTGLSDRQVLQVAQSERVDKEMGRLRKQGVTEDQLQANFRKGTSDQAIAAGLTLAERGKLKDKPDDVKRLRDLVGTNDTLKQKFDDFNKKTMDPDAMSEAYYNGFKDKEGGPDKMAVETLIADVKEGKVDLENFIGDLNEEDRDMFVKGLEEDGGEGKGGLQLLQNIGADNFENFYQGLKRKGKEDVLGKLTGNVEHTDFKTDKERHDFYKTTGRIDQAYAPEQIEKVIKGDIKVAVNSLGKKSLEKKEVAKAVVKSLEKGDIGKMNKGQKDGLKTGLNSAMQDNNANSDVSPVANNERIMHTFLTKGGDIENTFDIDNEENTHVHNELENAIKNEKIKPKDLSNVKEPSEKLTEHLATGMSEFMIRGLYKENQLLAEKIIKQINNMAATGDEKAEKKIRELKHLEWVKPLLEKLTEESTDEGGGSE